MTEHFDTVVLGGGASGMVAAVLSAEHKKKTLLIEKSNRLGRKIAASGNGRCNMMNSGPLKYYGNPNFAENVIRNCGVEELIRFFRHFGLLVKEEKEGRIYPVTMQSVSVLNMLQNAMKINHVEVLLNTEISCIQKKKNLFVCSTKDGKEYKSKEPVSL